MKWTSAARLRLRPKRLAHMELRFVRKDSRTSPILGAIRRRVNAETRGQLAMSANALTQVAQHGARPVQRRAAPDGGCVAGNLFESVTNGLPSECVRPFSLEIVDPFASRLVELHCGRCRALSRKEDFHVF